MVKNMHRHIVMKGESSKLFSMSGKGIGGSSSDCRESMKGLKEGMLIFQGGSNSLWQLRPVQTVKKVTECVREIKEKKVRVAVVVILGRPRKT